MARQPMATSGYMQTIQQTASAGRYGGRSCGPFNNVSVEKLLSDWHDLPRAGWCGKYPGIVAQIGRDFTADDLLAYVSHRAYEEQRA